MQNGGTAGGPKHLHSGFEVCGYVILAIEALRDVYRGFNHDVLNHFKVPKEIDRGLGRPGSVRERPGWLTRESAVLCPYQLKMRTTALISSL